MSNEVLGFAFLVISAVMTLLMYHAWGFPFDKETHRSAAPRKLVWTHRLLGYAYLAIYIYLMLDMVPRLWTYQIELPARTVAHLLLGMSIAVLLVLKITIVRFFKHLEARLVPLLGTALFVCSFLLVGLALPVQVREVFLRNEAIMGGSFSDDRLLRVRTQLPKAGLEDEQALTMLATTDGLLRGRDVLQNKCVQCHDLRTVLAKPRTPSGWRNTVGRMAERSTVLDVISDTEQWEVTAYLIAISPTLQETLKQRRAQTMAQDKSRSAANVARKSAMEPSASAEPMDEAAARALFETSCSQCHAYQQIEVATLESTEAVADLVARMVSNGLNATDDDLSMIIRYVSETYVTEAETSAAAQPPPPTPAAAPANASPAPGDAEIDTTVVLRPLGEDLQFENDVLEVKAGSAIRLEFDNTSGLEHNFALVAMEADVDEVIASAFDAADNGYLPQTPSLITGIPVVAPGNRAHVNFAAPPTGEYEFLCLMPGHSYTMQGVLRVTE